MLEVIGPVAEDISEQIQHDRNNQSSKQYQDARVAQPAQQIGDANGDNKPKQTPGRKVIKFG